MCNLSYFPWKISNYTLFLFNEKLLYQKNCDHKRIFQESGNYFEWNVMFDCRQIIVKILNRLLMFWVENHFMLPLKFKTIGYFLRIIEPRTPSRIDKIWRIFVWYSGIIFIITSLCYFDIKRSSCGGGVFLKWFVRIYITKSLTSSPLNLRQILNCSLSNNTFIKTIIFTSIKSSISLELRGKMNKNN